MIGTAPSTREQWRFMVVAVGGLLAAIVVAGSVALVLMLSVAGVTHRALQNDVVLEDLADDLRVAVLDVRHFQQAVLFDGSSPAAIQRFDEAYERLIASIDSLRTVPLDSLTVASPDDLHVMAESYHAALRPAIDPSLAGTAGSAEARELAMDQLSRLEVAAQAVDESGEARAAAALRDVEQSTTTATFILIVVIAGAAVAGAALTWAALRVLGALRRLSAERLETSARLESALRTRSRFISDASHELRTPLTVLRGNAELGLASPSTRCGHDALFREIVDEAASMGRLVDDLLFLARSDDGSVPLHVRDVAIGPWLADVAERAEVVAAPHGTRAEALLIADGNGRFDPERVAQAILSLVDNAARYGPRDGTVRLFARIQRWRLTVEVTDQGPGIAGSDLPLVFERFHRIDTTRRRPGGGVGLGLPIARTIVEAHGGRLLAWSRPGVGTTMTVELPLVSKARRRADTDPTPGARGASSRNPVVPAGTSVR